MALDPYFPSATVAAMRTRGRPLPRPRTPWVSFPGEYSARCRSADGATWLQVTHDTPGDRRPVVSALTGSRWGLHIYDVQLALGDLVALVRSQARAYLG